MSKIPSQSNQVGEPPRAMSRIWRWNTTFAALRNRHFRWLWLGRLASSATFQMGGVAQGWLVYQLTGSALSLGWVSSGWSISTLLLSLYGGVISDRAEKRALLLWARVAMALNTLGITLLISMGAIRIWHLVASSLISGVLFSFLMPAQQTIVAELVDRRTLLNAVALNSIGMGVMGILSALATGFLIELAGVASVYYVMAAFQLLAIVTVAHLPTTGRRRGVFSSVWFDLREGLRYLGHSPALLTLLGLTLSRVLLAMPYRTFMPKFAKETMGLEATGLGLLMAAPGIGSLTSSLVVASLGNFQGKGKLLLTAGVASGASLLLFVSVRSLPLVLLFLALVGAAGNISMVTNNTLLQANSSSRFRGRVMSVYMMMWGLSPLGTLPAGAVVDRMGVPFVVALQGVLLALIFLAVALLRPEARQLE